MASAGAEPNVPVLASPTSTAMHPHVHTATERRPERAASTDAPPFTGTRPDAPASVSTPDTSSIRDVATLGPSCQSRQLGRLFGGADPGGEDRHAVPLAGGGPGHHGVRTPEAQRGCTPSPLGGQRRGHGHARDGGGLEAGAGVAGQR